MSSRSVADLRPEIKPLVGAWLNAMQEANLQQLITCTLRSEAEQANLWAIGRTVIGEHPTTEMPMGMIVTKAQPGQSAHNYGLALDFVIMNNGKPDWSGFSIAWNQAITLAQSCGLQSLRPMESAHLQHPNWKEIAGVK